jgi:hypothetical protein
VTLEGRINTGFDPRPLSPKCYHTSIVGLFYLQ